ncbi:PBS lyase HEAT domain protein repeat-containing protein [Halothece sp. PCC 7418]|uniref:HEAT repeat domain-containing protein n=1 Tax=Halothece sp. (strain PCC 7418) TaxID=65093 RepID=UPI0002A07552|nr:HEAT repeat domain-containing protein [Halothece sp. PCC 7418]AFZ43608.1 PBS lyase HEAT domain protein repeat-containing protein [Halothece sp. PCC 7418]
MELYQYLQQLPLSSDPKKLIELPPKEKEAAFNRVWEAFLNGDFQQRWEVAKYLPKFGDSAIAPLSHLLEDETADLDLRCEAAGILGQFDDTNAILTLTEILNRESEPEVIAACTHALAKKGKTAIPILTAALAHAETRYSAVQALAYLREPEMITPLMKVIDDPAPEIRSIAIEALSTFRNSQVIPVLISALEDTHPQVRQEAVIACGVRGRDQDSEQVVSALIPLLYDINLEICLKSAIALGKLGTSTAIEALAKCLNSAVTPTALKQQIVRSLTQLENPQTLSLLTTSLREQPETIQEEIIMNLGRWKTTAFKTTIAETLMQFFEQSPEAQSNPKLKQGLALALGHLGMTTGKKLLSQLSHDETASVRIHAEAALKKLP